jgi:hypothetical protein
MVEDNQPGKAPHVAKRARGPSFVANAARKEAEGSASGTQWTAYLAHRHASKAHVGDREAASTPCVASHSFT